MPALPAESLYRGSLEGQCRLPLLDRFATLHRLLLVGIGDV